MKYFSYGTLRVKQEYENREKIKKVFRYLPVSPMRRCGATWLPEFIPGNPAWPSNNILQVATANGYQRFEKKS